MLWGAHSGGLEVRTLSDGETRLAGRFPYGSATELRGGPSPRREMFAARAFAARIEGGQDIHLLANHDFAAPLASRGAGSLTLTDTDTGLEFEARISAAMRDVSFVRDFLGTLAAGLVGGISPGFGVPDGGEEIRREGDGLLRVIHRADLIEISAVTKPAYPQAQIEARNWQPLGDVAKCMITPRQRWRA